MTNDEDDDPFERFALSAMLAISAFAEQECDAMAGRIRHALRRLPASGLFGDDHGHRSLWDEYCFEVRHGPTIGLEYAWTETLHPFVVERVQKLSRSVAVLLTIAAEYGAKAYINQDGRTRDDAQISGAIRDALYRLADEQPDLTGQYR